MTDSMAFATVVDSLQRVIAEKDSLLAAAHPPDALAVLEKLNGFYSSAWSQLIIYITVALAFVGILIPAASLFVQRQLLKMDERRLMDALAGGIDDLAKTLETRMKHEVAGMLSEAIAETEARTSHIASGLYTVQGNFLINRGGPLPAAAESYASALLNALKARDIRQVHVTSDNALMIVKRLSQDEVGKPPLRELLETAIERMAAENEKHGDRRFSEKLAALIPEYRRLGLNLRGDEVVVR